MASKCFFLSTQSVCGPEYNGYPVLISPLTPTIAYFEDQMSSIRNSSKVITAFKLLACKDGQPLLDLLNQRRFHASYQCSLTVNSALKAGCKIQTGLNIPIVGPVICKDRCDLATSTLNNIFQDPNSCPGTNPGREKLVESFKQYCQTAETLTATQGGLCVKGMAAESKVCGFPSQIDAVDHCKKITAGVDECCDAFLKTVPSAAPIVIGNGKKPTVVGDGSAVSRSVENGKIKQIGEVSESLSQPLIIGVSIGGALFFLLIIVILCIVGIKKRKSRRNKLQTTNKSAYSNFDDYDRLQNRPDTPLRIQSAYPQIAQQFQDYQQQGETEMLIVIHPYSPLRSDELQLDVDGWGLGLNPMTGQKGAFPLVCAEETYY